MRTPLTRLVCAVFVLFGGCFSERTDFADGELACSMPARQCPAGYECASDNRCYRGVALLPDGRVVPDAGPCSEGTLSCRDRDVMRCTGGQLVVESTCDVACSSGFCIACEPDSLRCSGTRPQQCTTNGAWMDLPSCPAATPQCEDGACVPPCSPVGVRRCAADGSAVQECEAAGQFRDVAECSFVCLADAIPHCGGECTPGARQCGPGQTPQHCDERGQWVDEATCAGVCMDASCVGECLPSDTRCASATTVETCSSVAMWGAAAACPFVCLAATGDCGGVCTPDARRCNGTRAELCSATGAWELDRDCELLPCTGGSCTPCTSGTTQCNAGIPQQCVDGDWVDQRSDACPFLCSPTEGCVGECVPGSEICAPDDVHRTCGADAFYDDETCTFVCLSGDCTGVCEPGAQRCNGDAAQRCNSTGAWSGGMTCAFGCDTATGECKACVPELLDETCEGGGCGPKVNNCGTTVTCPACTGTGETCGGGGIDGFCGCIAESANVTCQGGARCVATANNCGNLVECPDLCVAPQSCGGGGAAGTCGCTPLTTEVACAGKNCGAVSNGCGGTISCWPDGQTSCPGVGETCGGGNVENVCGCTVDPGVCAGRVCGQVPNNCGGMTTCQPNSCASGTSCNSAGQCVMSCTPTACPATFECGTHDPGCGADPIACGAGCTSPEVCEPSTHLCICVPGTTCSGGKVCGTEPDGCGGTVTCGACATGWRCSADQLTCRCPTDAEAGCGSRECGPPPAPVLGCAIECGDVACAADQRCDATGTCTCLPKGMACTGKCGDYTTPAGNCSYDCGGCSGQDSCNTTTHTCECVRPNPCPTTDGCGTITDACGTDWDCGDCPAGSCVDNVCLSNQEACERDPTCFWDVDICTCEA